MAAGSWSGVATKEIPSTSRRTGIGRRYSGGPLLWRRREHHRWRRSPKRASVCGSQPKECDCRPWI